MENWRERMSNLTDFGKGVIAGFIITAIVTGIIAGLYFRHNKDKEFIEYAEKQIEIEELREDYVNCDPVEFIETIPDVRAAVDGTTADFNRKLNEIFERYTYKPDSHGVRKPD
jgi:hypothetical protein